MSALCLHGSNLALEFDENCVLFQQSARHVLFTGSRDFTQYNVSDLKVLCILKEWREMFLAFNVANCETTNYESFLLQSMKNNCQFSERTEAFTTKLSHKLHNYTGLNIATANSLYIL